MNMKKRSWIISAALVLFIVMGLAACQQGMMEGGAKSSNMAPNFTLNDLNGKPHTLSSTKGKVVILDFWATWCPPCREEIPHFISLYGKYRRKGLEVIGISLDRGGTEPVRRFVDTNGINYPILMGDQKVTRDYGGIRSIPTTFIIDRQGRITEKFVGYRSEKVFEDAIKGLL